MNRFIKILSIFILFCPLFLTSALADGQWTIFSSYHNPKKAVKMGSLLYTLANDRLFSYDTEDGSVETFDKTNSLSDIDIYDIALCSATKQLFILYSNGNIDIMDRDGECTNMSDLKSIALSASDLNELCISGREAFISTTKGLIVIDVANVYFKDTYKFTGVVKSCLANANFIYSKTSDGTYRGDRKLNLLNKNNWTLMSSADLAADEVYKSLKNENVNDAALLEQVKDKCPNSPIRNYSYKLNMVDDRLLVAGGNFYYGPEIEYPATAMKYENGKWTNFEEQEAIDLVGSQAYMNITEIIQDPRNPERHWLGTKRSGLYEFENYKLKNHYTYNNSPITSILPDNPNAGWYTRVTGLQFDKDNNLWMMNNECDTIVRILKNDGTWKALYYDDIKGCNTFRQTYFDSRGWVWLVQWYLKFPKFTSSIFVIDTNGTVDTEKDDKTVNITRFVNQDGSPYQPVHFQSITEDLDGNLWIGTTDGLFVTYEPANVFNSDFYLTQIKVPRNDGSDLADYLLTGVDVKCVAIDGANRKWVGTNSNGVYLISADGLETIEHFTTENSPLISNTINDIAIDGKTGEVFIATYNGLCSYKGDATDPERSMSSNTLKVYPNPVSPEYSGDVHITGLAYNSNVKIANAAGRLVHEGISNGGRFDWNCCDRSGNRVSSGIYYALCTDEEGKKGACAKILIIR